MSEERITWRMLMEPPHLMDHNAPCWGCGARWESNSRALVARRTGQTMNHRQGCRYLAAQDSEARAIEAEDQ